MSNELNPTITIRRLGATDSERAALARLAQLDSTYRLDGPALGAEVEGRLLAAISLDTGQVIADPFSRTTELRAMLKLRVAQLTRPPAGRRRSRFGALQRIA